MSKTVLVLTPHPDDAEVFAGGTIAKMVAEGHRVVIVIASSGNKGSFEYDADTLAAIRREEATRAAAVLGAAWTATADDKLPIKMLNDRLLVRIPDKEGERRSSGGILIPATAQVGKRLAWADRARSAG